MRIPLVRGTSTETIDLVPSKIVAIGVNYRAHAVEMGKGLPEEPLLFLKPPSAMIASGEAIERPGGFDRVDYEAELGVVINQRARRVPRERALDVVLGYVCINDVSVRELQRRDGQWIRAKGFDTFCPIGEAVSTPIPYGELTVITRVNGEERQRGTGAQMVFSIPHILSYISNIMTLEPGDLVLTGTPAGVGPLKSGDEVEVEVVGVSKVKNRVA